MKKQIENAALGLVVATLFTASLAAQNENIWQGGKAGLYADWHVASNWSEHRIPNEHDVVVIPVSHSYPVVTGTVIMQSILIETGAEIALRGKASLVVLHNRANVKFAPSDLQIDENRYGDPVVYQGVRNWCPIYD